MRPSDSSFISRLGRQNSAIPTESLRCSFPNGIVSSLDHWVESSTGVCLTKDSVLSVRSFSEFVREDVVDRIALLVSTW